jgi:lactoylglutathione lyase
MHIINGVAERKTYYKNQHSCRGQYGKPKAVAIRVDGIKPIWLQDPDVYRVEINDTKD